MVKSLYGLRCSLLGVALLAVILAPLAACEKGNMSAPTYTLSAPPPTHMVPTPPTEEHLGTIDPHALAYFTFNTSRLGPVQLAAMPQGYPVPPPPPDLSLALRVGHCPDTCGQLIADSNLGGVITQVAAGTYSVIVSNPHEQAVRYLLVMYYPK
jgi:hypothetical protein